MQRDERITSDVVVVGAGAGGMTVAIGLADLGRSVTLVEAGQVGGDCTNVGCIPSKRLIHLAHHPGGRSCRQILAEVRRTRDSLAETETHELRERPGLTLLRGRASLSGPEAVAVRTSQGNIDIEAQNIVLATGARPAVLDVPGLPADRVVTNEQIFDLVDRPGHLVVVGAGAVGTELASVFGRLGSRVTLVEAAERVLPAASPRASAVVQRRMEGRGIQVHTGMRPSAFEEASRALTIVGGGASYRIDSVDTVLMAVGREPNIESIGLEAAGVESTDEGIRVDSWGRTNVPNIWAVGDVVPDSHQTHAANARGRRIVQRIGLPWLPARGRPGAIPSAVFTDPEVAWVSDPRRGDRRGSVTIEIDLATTDRALTDDLGTGFISVDASRWTGRIHRATVVGPSASEVIATLTLAIDRGVSLARLSRLVWAYPTHSAAIGAVGDEFLRRTFGALAARMPRLRGGP